MKILQVHNRYQARGGEDTVVAQEQELLRSAGHEVQLHEAFNRPPAGAIDTAKMAGRLIHNVPERRRLRDAIESFRPDLVHFHNTFLAMGTSVLSVPHEVGIPSCLTAHNHRLFCIAGTAFRDGQTCTDCMGQGPWAGARHGCYRDSRTLSTLLAAAHRFHERTGTALHLDAIGCLNPIQKQRLADHGIPEALLYEKPNFTPLGPTSDPKQRTSILFLGLLSRAKGVYELMERHDPKAHLPLEVVGTGPAADDVRAWAAGNKRITTHGFVNPGVRMDEIWKRTRFLVAPSIAPEGAPMVVLEALARGIPVIAPHVIVARQLAIDGSAVVYGGPERRDLAEALAAASATDDQTYEQMCDRARRLHESRFSPAAALPKLMDLYERAIEHHRRRAE